MDCHSTLRFLVAPHSAKVSPTALSVMSFQLAENQTLNVPGEAPAACVAGVAAAAAAVVGAPAAVVGAPAGGLVGCAAACGLDAGGAAHAASARPTAQAFRVR